MEEENNPSSPKSTPQMPSNNKAHKSWVMWLLAGLAVILLALAGYLWWQLQECKDREKALQQEKQQLQAQVESLQPKEQPQAEANGGEQACNDTPTEALKENIKAALDSKNTAVFATYVSNPVTFVIAASEKGGQETPDQAAQDMDYANSATGPWDFSLPQGTIDDYDAGFYTDYFDANTYVGRATSGQVAAFDFDCDGKISKIFLAANEDIL